MPQWYSLFDAGVNHFSSHPGHPPNPGHPAGEVMPQKSTDFYPKLMSGITMYSVDGD
jgi:hypothetical protein